MNKITATHDRHSGIVPAPEPGSLIAHDVFRVLLILRRRLWLILGIVLLVMLGMVYLVQKMPNKYTASSLIVLDTKSPQVVKIDSVIPKPETMSDPGLIQSETDILRNDTLIREVVQKLNLPNYPEFTEKRRQGIRSHIAGYFSGVTTSLPEEIRMFFAQDEAPAAVTPPTQSDLQIQAAVDQYKRALKVGATGTHSYTIIVQFESVDPALAAQIVNTHVDLYLSNQVKDKVSINRQANAWLLEQLEDFRTKLKVAEDAVQKFRMENGIIVTKGETITGQQLAEVNTQVVLARAEVLQREAQLRQTKQALEKPNGLESVAQVLSSPLIQRLREQQAGIERDEAALLKQVGPKHPALIKVQSQKADVAFQIRSEIDRIVQSLERELNTSKVREASLLESFQQLQAKSGDISVAEVRLGSLEREAAASRQLFESFLVRYKQVNIQEDLQRADARLISGATPPLSPSSPMRSMILFSALIVAFLMSIGLAFVLELFNNRYRSVSDIESDCGIRGLGSIPLARGGLLRRRWLPHVDIIAHPSSLIAESVARIRTAIQFASVHARSKILLITSSLPNEGKSTFSVTYARSLAMAGRRVVLVDGDFRRPTISSLLDTAESGPGERLHIDGLKVSPIRRADAATPLHYITWENLNGQSILDLISSDEFRNFIVQLRQVYAYVIIDSPPVLAVSDALLLSALADGTVLVVRANNTPKTAVQAVVAKLVECQASMIGAVLSHARVLKRAEFSFGDVEYYHRAVKKYYQPARGD